MVHIRYPKGRAEGFCLDKTEVTVAEYVACERKGSCTSPGSESSRCNWDKKGYGSHPVNCVSYDQARAFCAFRGGRLPTEGEWITAVQGTPQIGTKPIRRFPWGDVAPVDGVCFRRAETCPVATMPRDVSRDGVHDLAGNVTEWTSTDCMELGDPHLCPSVEPLQVLKGGAFNDDNPDALRVEAIQVGRGLTQLPAIGFRCAKDRSAR